MNVRRAVIAPDGYLIFAGTYSAPCSIGLAVFNTGSGLFVGEMAPGSTSATVIDVPQGAIGEFADISIAADTSVWITYRMAAVGAAVSKVNRTGPASGFTLSLMSTTAGMSGSLLAGDLTFTPDGGLDVVGTVTAQGDVFGGVALKPDAGNDYDGFLVRLDPSGASQPLVAGTTGTDGFTHVLPLGSQDLIAGMCGYGGSPLPFCISSEYIDLFLDDQSAEAAVI